MRAESSEELWARMAKAGVGVTRLSRGGGGHQGCVGISPVPGVKRNGTFAICADRLLSAASGIGASEDRTLNP